MTSESPESATSRLDLKARLDVLDEQRLAQLPDGLMVAEVNQRRYLADLREKAQWKKKNQPFKFNRSRRRKK